jgi:hypothetical protein
MAVLDSYAGALVPDPRLDLLTPVADAQHDLTHAVRREQTQLMDEEWLTRHIQKWLRRRQHTIAEARPQPAGQDAHGR